ncbi:4Fe-4S dicluster domain-containing protein [Candidatus Hecatella orcuttiae]|uniref:4Fe-4S dicluster domain-containing protein n=1 Tax=Candidatus Hecatella orcuttiae TaxID=1935119 RepID=UPI002868160D|nr:4Fe-4S dicluster domain-containing protein [Candidatus Hecatella orcuttiae]
MPYLHADPLECTGCRICELSCAFLHEHVLNPKKARVRVVRREEGQDIPVACRHCEKPACIEACPEGAIRKVEKTGLVVINQKKCTGCTLCVDACPYDAIFMHPSRHVAINCTLCGFCVKQCPVRCLEIVKGE